MQSALHRNHMEAVWDPQKVIEIEMWPADSGGSKDRFHCTSMREQNLGHISNTTQ